MKTQNNRKGVVHHALTEFALKQHLSLEEIKIYLKRKYGISVSTDALERRLQRTLPSAGNLA